jgi:hypothetical protein
MNNIVCEDNIIMNNNKIIVQETFDNIIMNDNKIIVEETLDNIIMNDNKIIVEETLDNIIMNDNKIIVEEKLDAITEIEIYDTILKIMAEESIEYFSEYDKLEMRKKALLRILRKKSFSGRIINFYNKHKRTVLFSVITIISFPIAIVAIPLFIITYPICYFGYHCGAFGYLLITGTRYQGSGL